VSEQDEWVEANQAAVTKALLGASALLYALLGGQPDPERQREATAAEVARLKLTIKRSRRS
jgi:hypothetical protein